MKITDYKYRKIIADMRIIYTKYLIKYLEVHGSSMGAKSMALHHIRTNLHAKGFCKSDANGIIKSLDL